MSSLRDLSRDEMAQHLDEWMGHPSTVDEASPDWLEQALATATREPQASPNGPDAWSARGPRTVVSAAVFARAAAAVLLIGGVVGVVAVVIERSDAPTPNIIPPVATTVPPETTVTPATTVTPVTTVAAVITEPPEEMDRAGLLRTGPYDILTVRAVEEPGRSGVDVFTESVDGDTRMVRHIDNSELPDGWTLTGYGEVSSTAWLALDARWSNQYGWAFVDLLATDRPPLLVDGITFGAEWGPTDLFALSLNGGRPAVIDPLTGEVAEVTNAEFPGGHPDIIWSADGEGFLASDGGSYGDMSEVDGSSNIQPRTWRMTPLDGSADQPGVPELDPFGTTRYVAEGGNWLTIGACQSVLDLCVPSGQLFDGTYQNRVVVADAAGNSTTWYDNDVEDARLMQSSFSADGRSIWLLLERTGASGAEVVLAQATAPREIEIVATLPSVEPLPDVPLPDGGYGVGYFASLWLSPDDALAVITSTQVKDGVPQSDRRLIRTDGSGLAVPIEDDPIGFLPISVADVLP